MSKLPRSLTIDEILTATNADPELQELKSCINKNLGKKSLPQNLSSYGAIFHELISTSDGLLLRAQNLIVPKSFRDRVAELAHIGHQGVVKTKRLIRSRLWYPGIDAQIETIVKDCRKDAGGCQATDFKRNFEPLRPTELPKGPWQDVSADFFGPMPD